MRLVNHFFADAGRKNILWNGLCQRKWSEKLCLTTLPLPWPRIPDHDNTDSEIPVDTMEPMSFEKHMLSMEQFEDHAYDMLRPAKLYDIAKWFPAFHCIEGSWMRAYNLVEQHMEIPYLHATMRKDQYSISDTQWELYVPKWR